MGAPAMRRNLSGSLVPSSSLGGSLAKDLTPSRRKLIDQGLHSLLDEIVADLKGETLAQQLKALRALHGLTRSRGSTEAIQGRFREDGGLALLVGILRATNGSDASGAESAEVHASATEALFFLTRNNADSRAEAVRVGGVAGLAQALGAGAALPPSVFTLRALHSLLSPDPAGEAAAELLAAGGVHALVALLGRLAGGSLAPEQGSGTWVQEVLALLEPAAGRCRAVADLVAGSAAPVCEALLASTEPLTLSLGLDILEEVLAKGQPGGAARRLAGQGALAALLHAVRLRGFGAKAAHSLACLVSGDPLLRGALAALLQPEDVAALVRTAAAAARAKDVEAAAPAKLLGELLGGGPAAAETAELSREADCSLAPNVLRTVIAACCTGACLATELVRGPLLTAAGSAAGALVLRNLPERHAAEAAIAAAQLLPHLPAAAGALRRPGALPLLVAAFLEEQARGDEVDASAGLEATGGVVSLLRALPAAPEPPPPPPARPREPPAANGGGYASVTFHVGGREYVALGWALQRASPAIARTLAGIPESDAAAAAVVIPDVPGLAPERLFRLFAAACDFAQSGALAADSADVLALWTVAAVLQMEALQQRCEAVAAEQLLGQPGQLAHALELAGRYPTAGSRLCDLCCSRLASALAAEQGGQAVWAQLHALAGTCREPLQLGFERLLGRLLSQHLPGDEPQQPAAAPATASGLSDARDSLTACSIGSFKEWVGQGQAQPRGARAAYRPGSLDFPATPAASEIEPLPDSPPGRR